MSVGKTGQVVILNTRILSRLMRNLTAPYCLVDMKVNWEYQRLNLYAELNNLLNSTYYDLGNIPQPVFGLKQDSVIVSNINTQL